MCGLESSELDERNPSLWRCLQAQRVLGESIEYNNPSWMGPSQFHQTPCRAGLSFQPDFPNLIVWNGSLHQAALSFKPDVIPSETGATVSYFG